MNSKERMLATINHEEPDQVPIGEWEYGRELIEPTLGRKSLFPFDLERIKAFWSGRRDDVISDWKTGLVKMTRKLGWDAVLAHVAIGKNTKIEVPEQIEDYKWRDSSGNLLCYSVETDRMAIVGKDPEYEPPTADTNDNEETSPSMEPNDSELEVVRHVVKELGDTHFIMSAPLIGHPKLRFGNATSGGQVELWVQLYEEPDKFLEECMRGLENPDTRLALEISKREGIDGICYGRDYGTNTGPFMAPEMFKKYIFPHLAEYVKLVHEYGFVFLHHACGNNQELMDMIVEAGVDVYQSIQPEMDIVKMKKRYGKNITLWGGVPSGDLITSTPDQVRKEANHYLNECKPEGGYVFGTSHSVMPGIKYENYQAMLEAHKEFGIYNRS